MTVTEHVSSREFQCQRCLGRFPAPKPSGRLPERCDRCKRATGRGNRIRGPATEPEPRLDTIPPRYGVEQPGPIERSLRDELARMRIASPLAGTLSLVALKIARAADLQPADDLKGILLANDKLQRILADLSARELGSGGDDRLADGYDLDGVEIGIFGPVRAEIRPEPLSVQLPAWNPPGAYS